MLSYTYSLVTDGIKLDAHQNTSVCCCDFTAIVVNVKKTSAATLNCKPEFFDLRPWLYYAKIESFDESELFYVDRDASRLFYLSFDRQVCKVH